MQRLSSKPKEDNGTTGVDATDTLPLLVYRYFVVYIGCWVCCRNKTQDWGRYLTNLMEGIPVYLCMHIPTHIQIAYLCLWLFSPRKALMRGRKYTSLVQNSLPLIYLTYIHIRIHQTVTTGRRSMHSNVTLSVPMTSSSWPRRREQLVVLRILLIYLVVLFSLLVVVGFFHDHPAVGQILIRTKREHLCSSALYHHIQVISLTHTHACISQASQLRYQ